MKLFKILAIALAGIIISGCLALALYLFVIRPPLIRGLSSEIAVAKVEFKEKVETSFSAKTSNKEITQDLISQGFEVSREANQKVTAHYQESNLACVMNYYITWEIDEQGYIFNLEAKRLTGCL
jgi:hypothetical protein